MKEEFFSFMFGASIGIGMLLCPQIRHFVDKTSEKLAKKMEKIKNTIKEDETSD